MIRTIVHTILLSLGVTCSAQTTALEAWEFDDTAGTDLASAVNDVGTAEFIQSSNTATNGNGQLIASQDTTNYFRDADTLSVGNGSATAGTYQLEFYITTLDLSTGDSTGANVGFGFRDSSLNQDIFLIRLQKQNDRLYLSTRIDNVNSNLVDFGAGITGISDLAVRCSINLDTDIAEVFYTYNDLPEASAGTTSLSATANTWDRLRYVCNSNPTDWGATDSISIDYLRVSAGAPAQVNYDTIPLDSPLLYTQGAQFKTIDAEGMHFLRFDDSIYSSNNTTAKVNPIKAKTTSGVKLTFYTSSPTIKLEFVYDENDQNLNSQFALYQNGVFTGEFFVNKTEASSTLTIQNLSDPLEVVRHDIVLPSWANPILSKVEIETGETLLVGNPIRQKKIVFLGDSISHGTGQGSASYKTYPFQVSEKLNLQSFNLAVGGGKASPPVADLLQYFGDVDIIWILVGYNNWQGSSQDIATITSEYQALLTTVRNRQPSAKVFCNTLLYSRNSVDIESGVTIDEVREAVASVVNTRIAAGDDRLYLVRPETFTNDSYLRFEEDGVTPHSDSVHLSEIGATMFADDVHRILSPHVFPKGASAHWDFNFNETGNSSENRVTKDGIDEANLYIDGAITLGGQESEGLVGRAQVNDFEFGIDRSLSVEMTFKMSTIANQQRLFRMFDNATNEGTFAGLQNGKVIFKLNEQPILTGSTVISDSDWHTLAFSWNADTDRASLYLDGVLEATTVYPNEVLPNSVASLNGLTLGLSVATIDDVQIANRVEEFRSELPAPVDYATWVSTFNWDGEIQTGENDDPDLDGMNNFLEFTLGSNPIQNDMASMSPTLEEEAGKLYYNFTMGRSSDDLEYYLQFSEDLINWNQITPLRIYGEPSDSVSVRLADYISNPSEGFIRLAAVEKQQP